MNALGIRNYCLAIDESALCIGTILPQKIPNPPHESMIFITARVSFFPSFNHELKHLQLFYSNENHI